MNELFTAVGRFSRRQKLVVAAMAVIIVLTWLAVCLILTGVLAP